MKTHAEQMKRKELTTALLKDCFERASITIFADYRGEGSGMTVKEITELRGKLRESGGEFRVVKNTLTQRVANELGIEGLEPHLKGPTAIAFGFGDPASVAKAILDFAKDNKEKPLPAVRTSYMDGKLLDEASLQAIADLPTLPQLQQQLLGLMLAPHRNIMGVMHAPGRQVATVIDAYRKKMEEGGAA